LMHNHPSGDPTPSQADIQMTQEIVNVARPLGISVHDHIIVGRDGHASLKGLRVDLDAVPRPEPDIRRTVNRALPSVLKARTAGSAGAILA
jgi:hypothetical protein